MADGPSHDDDLVIVRRAGIATMTINRPRQRNAVTRTMWRRMTTEFEEIARSDADRVFVLTGMGEAFCSGADLSASDRSSIPPATLMRDVAKAAVTLQRLPKPTIARVDGAAVGAGLGLALACDIVVASERARFGASFSKRAMSTDFATSWLLPRLAGMQVAKELVFLARMIGADEAHSLGLVNRVVPADQLDLTVSNLADELLAMPQMALSMSKEMLNRSFEWTIEEALDAEARAQEVNLAGTDVVEARRAFMEKREPVFGLGSDVSTAR